jgi:hypothetical protein
MLRNLVAVGVTLMGLALPAYAADAEYDKMMQDAERQNQWFFDLFKACT